MVNVFLDFYPELAVLFNRLQSGDRDWLDQFCNSYKFSILIGKFLKYQLENDSPILSVTSHFLSHCVFLTGYTELIDHLITEDSLNVLSTRLGYLLLATLDLPLPKLESTTPVINNTELLIIKAWQEFRKGRYNRVIGLLSNLSLNIELDAIEPLLTNLYLFLNLISFIETRNSKQAQKWKDSVIRIRSRNKSQHRFYDGLLEMSVGIWYSSFGENEIAEEYLNKSWKKFEVFSNYYFLFIIGENMGILAQKSRKFNEAREIFSNLLKKRDEVGTADLDCYSVFRVETNLANLSYDMGNIDEAIKYAEDAVKLFYDYKIPILDGIFTLTEFYAVKGDITKARSTLSEGINTDWIPKSEIDNPDYFRTQAQIEKHACNFTISSEYFSVALSRYKKANDLNKFLECLAELVILNLEIFFWRHQHSVLNQATMNADEIRLLVEGQAVVGWSYISKVMQAITRALSNRSREAKKLIIDAQSSSDIAFFKEENRYFLNNIDLDSLSTSRTASLKAIEFLTSLLPNRDQWRIEESSPELLYLVVLDSESSLPIFVYYFDESFKIDRVLVSGLISAMNTMSRSLSLKELNEIRYRDSLVLVGHRDPLLFALVSNQERATVGMRLKLLEFTENFPDFTIGESRFQMDFSENEEILELVKKSFILQ
ncbi:MAG: hypothetical protein ACW964_05920 [Candidatus Hodarchaeales archaeon]